MKFSVYFARKPKNEVVRHAGDNVVYMNKRRILVVEDEAAIRRGLCDVLAYHGHEPIPVATGTDGLREALTGRYDLLIEVVCETRGAFQSFLEQHCFGHDDIDQIEVMSGIEMFKNQFLLKRQTQ